MRIFGVQRYENFFVPLYNKQQYNMCINKLILGDNLEILRAMESETVDLIYLDPPFFSNRDYEVIWGDEGEVRSFQDRWAGGIDHYIAWLKERVIEMHRVLKPTGSIFLHCDWHANAEIKVDILNKLFGRNNFRNEIVWCYKTRPQSKKYFGRKHDSIFFYSKTEKYTFHWDCVARSLSDVTISKYKLKDEDGRLYRLEGRGLKESPIRSAKDVGPKWEKTNPELVIRDYLDEKTGVALEDWWNIDTINQNSKELIGYPTQKPVALLERIIKCASNEGDLVLDPFMGGGTTIAVADKLNRHWIGIDQSVQAVKVTELRLHQQTDLFTSLYANSYTLQLHKYDYDLLRNKDAFEFESWIIGQFGGTPHGKKGGDAGIDGTAVDGAPVQVKRSENVGRNVIDNFLSAVKRADKKLYDKSIEDKKPVGYIIAFSFSKGAIQEVARLKNQENIIIELVPVDTIIPVSQKPALKIEVDELSRDISGIREIEFIATGNSPAGIEFYSWDFDYEESKGFKPIVIRDVEGKQRQQLKAGIYHIAVKAVDNNGLENIETIKLKINGMVQAV
jgi:DNA modification methylase